MSLAPAVNLWNVYESRDKEGTSHYSVTRALYVHARVETEEGATPFVVPVAIDVGTFNEPGEPIVVTLSAMSEEDVNQRVKDEFRCSRCGAAPRDLRREGVKGWLYSSFVHAPDCGVAS